MCSRVQRPATVRRARRLPLRLRNVRRIVVQHRCVRLLECREDARHAPLRRIESPLHYQEPRLTRRVGDAVHDRGRVIRRAAHDHPRVRVEADRCRPTHAQQATPLPRHSLKSGP